MEERTLRCPNCGANTTDARNCEFCGSLLVRFVDKGIDLSQTTYLDDTETFPGLINALKLNLQLQESTNESVVTTDIVGPVTHNDSGRDYIGCVLRNGNISYHDGSPVPSTSKKGICIAFCFDPYLDKDFEKYNTIQEERRKRFKALDCYPLFMEHICFNTDYLGYKRKNYEYFIDFGEDAEGAARLISKVWKEVHEIPFDSNVEYYTNAGGENVEKTRKIIEAERDGTEVDNNEYDDEDKGISIPNWCYWVIAFLLYGLFKMCS